MTGKWKTSRVNYNQRTYTFTWMVNDFDPLRVWIGITENTTGVMNVSGWSLTTCWNTLLISMKIEYVAEPPH